MELKMSSINRLLIKWAHLSSHLMRWKTVHSLLCQSSNINPKKYFLSVQLWQKGEIFNAHQSQLRVKLCLFEHLDTSTIHLTWVSATAAHKRWITVWNKCNLSIFRSLRRKQRVWMWDAVVRNNRCSDHSRVARQQGHYMIAMDSDTYPKVILSLATEQFPSTFLFICSAIYAKLSMF